MPPAANPPSLMAPEQPLLPPQQGSLPMGGAALGAPPAGQPQPYRQLKVEDALAYLDQVKMKFEKDPRIYNKVRGAADARAPCGAIGRTHRGPAAPRAAPPIPFYARQTSETSPTGCHGFVTPRHET